MMHTAEERLLAHARAVRARGSSMPPDGLPSAEILDSWARCADAGLDLAREPGCVVVDDAELRHRREASAQARRFALAELETLHHQIAGSNFLLAFADPQGVILDLYADNRFRVSGSAEAIVVGSRWSEDVAGTNGLGSALASGQCLAVNGPEHYFFSFADISCTASPIRDATGHIVGVLDASSYFESRQRHTQALVSMAATHIENLLLAEQMRGHLVLAIHPRQEFLGTLSAGLLALDGEGCVSAFNGRAASLLAGLDLARGSSFEALFAESFEHVVAGLSRRGTLRLRDTLGSAVAAALVHAPSAAVWASQPLPAAAAAGLPRLRDGAPGQPEAAASRPAARAREAAPGQPLRADFVADDPDLQDGLRAVAAAVRLRVPILLHGETGTGKELMARHAHVRSGRRGAFVAVNCGAMPAELFEAELFGYVGGAFTGARREGSPGLITSADGGTLLLDEVVELPPTLQSALLRFLDDQQVRPVGGAAARQVDVQLLAATHADLEVEVREGRFRADLMYRLNTVRVDLPPLRVRRDFAALAQAVLAVVDPSARLDEAALALLASQSWPGNLRELRSVLTRALLAAGDARLGRADIERVLPAATAAQELRAPASALQRGAREQVLREFERTGGSVSRTSRNLGVSRTTVYRHLRSAARR